MASFQNGDGSFFNESAGAPVTIVAPSTGDTVAMASTDRALYVNNGSTLAALTIKLPLGVHNGTKVELAFKGTVTALTVEDGFGNAITGAPTAGAANTAQVMRYVYTIANPIGWVLWK